MKQTPTLLSERCADMRKLVVDAHLFRGATYAQASAEADAAVTKYRALCAAREAGNTQPASDPPPPPPAAAIDAEMAAALERVGCSVDDLTRFGGRKQVLS